MTNRSDNSAFFLRLLSISMLFLLAFGAYAQKTIDQLMAIKPIKADVYKTGTFGYQEIPVRMDFAQSTILKPEDLKKVNLKYVKAVSLVYTRFRLVESFDQPALNRDRYKELKKYLPGLFSQPRVSWFAVEQQSGDNPDDAGKLFHGFVISFRDSMYDTTRRIEIARINRILESGRDTVIHVPEDVKIKIKRVKVKTGIYLPKNKSKLKKGISYTKPGIWGRDEVIKTRKDTIVLSRTGGYDMTSRIYDLSQMGDTSMLRIIQRNKGWSDIAVVQDVTGSMSPYTAQLLIWMQSEKKLLENGKFVFFNDGDEKPDFLKKPGTTGGCYVAKNGDFDSVKRTVFRAMFNGAGGAIPENVIEALITAQSSFPEADTLVLIGDNAAPVSDLQLLPLLKKPVRIIACGANKPMNPHFLEIVRKTKGSLHTSYKDFLGVAGMKEGEEINLGRESYVLRGEKFIPLRKFK